MDLEDIQFNQIREAFNLDQEVKRAKELEENQETVNSEIVKTTLQR